jgi:hypothetical protein
VILIYFVHKAALIHFSFSLHFFFFFDRTTAILIETFTQWVKCCVGVMDRLICECIVFEMNWKKDDEKEGNPARR